MLQHTSGLEFLKRHTSDEVREMAVITQNDFVGVLGMDIIHRGGQLLNSIPLCGTLTQNI